MAVIIGIDPGSWTTGYGVVHETGSKIEYVVSGCVRNKNEVIATRLYQIYTEICALIERFKPTVMAIEQAFVHQNVNTALKLGQVRGALMIAASRYGLECAEYAPRVIKKTVVGYGAASKEQMQHMIRQLLRLSDEPPSDAADALAIAYCHALMSSHPLWQQLKARSEV